MNSNGTKKQKNNKIRLKVNRDMCKGCGICIAFCPQGVLERNQDEKAAASHVQKCNACGMCELRCPDLAIEVKQLKKASSQKAR